MMVALATRSKEQVRQAYELALKLGAVDEGSPRSLLKFG
jgi:hypothetical protein